MVSEGGGGGSSTRKFYLVVNTLMLSLGAASAPLLVRLYFIHGGERIWFSSWLETAGWPLIFLPLAINYLHRRSAEGPSAKAVLMNPFVFIMTAVIGILTGLDNYLYTYGLAKLPVSTSSLIIAAQLGFTAGFAFLLVKQKFTSYSINAVFLLMVGAGVLAMHTSSDRPKGESKKEYYTGFLMTLGAAALYGFILPLIELMYKRAKQTITYSLVLEVQLVMCFFATLFCTIGMIVNKDFQAMPREAKNYRLGETKYWLVILWNVIIWQFCFLGVVGVIYFSSSLFSGIVIAVLLPVTEILAVIFYREKFQVEKAVSLALSLWGFASYFYGETKESKKKQVSEETALREGASQELSAFRDGRSDV